MGRWRAKEQFHLLVHSLHTPKALGGCQSRDQELDGRAQGPESSSAACPAEHQ